MNKQKYILVLNCGSSSVKYALYDSSEKKITRGIVEEIGTKIKNHKIAISFILSTLVKKNYITTFQDISAVGHRVVHGNGLTKSVLVDKKIMKDIENAAVLAPLHNPHNIEGIRAIKKLLPSVPNIAVFDTSFHSTIPSHAATYGIPLSLSRKYKIKRYGFHGISYQYICEELKRELGKLPSRLLVCHLGNGASVSAIKDGKSVDTSMGFTPMEGLMMGTRSGDIDVGAVFHIAAMRNECRDMNYILNFESGLKGITGTNDMREIWKQAQKKEKTALLALEMYCYKIQKYIGAYTAALGGIDAVVFTAGVGENAWYVREKVCTHLQHLGIVLDVYKNKLNQRIISKGKVKVYVLPTDEEKMIAREVMRLFH
ncbi:acetate kinase [Candidatus Woesearchaeota archaeon]|nr:acetate kinase [Candidatus Woesearchaeota archaeon]